MPPPPALSSLSRPEPEALAIELFGRVAELTEQSVKVFRGYKTYMVQDLIVSERTVRYCRERWITPDGQTIVARLPQGTNGRPQPGPLRADAVSPQADRPAPPDDTAALG